MNAPIKVQDENGWRWSWNGWLSQPHELLEVRPWTPVVIAARLCFCAQDGAKRSVSWGDQTGPLLDDAYDVTECASKPLYVGRVASNYFLVWGSRRTQDFDFQITYALQDNSPIVVRFHSWKPSSGPPLEPHWRDLEHRDP